MLWQVVVVGVSGVRTDPILHIPCFTSSGSAAELGESLAKRHVRESICFDGQRCEGQLDELVVLVDDRNFRHMVLRTKVQRRLLHRARETCHLFTEFVSEGVGVVVCAGCLFSWLWATLAVLGCHPLRAPHELSLSEHHDLASGSF